MSFFADLGFSEGMELLKGEVRDVYLSDEIPWVLGYSGGKDSTATLQLVWESLRGLPKDKIHKKIYVVSTDTMVENPMVAMWSANSIDGINKQALSDGFPVEAHLLRPSAEDSFWVNIIGKGYPSPRINFRWCTDRLKIKPSNKFINDVVSDYGEAIMLLGTRRSESATRGRLMEKYDQASDREDLKPASTMPNCYVYSPIEYWSNDDVWTYLMQVDNPWGVDNKDLMNMYQGATEDGECPVVVDTSTPSCGSSRFGCWVCTLVDKDRSMAAMIKNDEEKSWMRPLLDFRNELEFRDDRRVIDDGRRDFRRMDGRMHIIQKEGEPKVVRGPYTQEAREFFLRELLVVQNKLRKLGPYPDIEVITLDELRIIRDIWISQKHEIEDNLPRIYKDVVGDDYPDGFFDDSRRVSQEEMDCLMKSCDGDLQFQLIRELLDVEYRFRTMSRRTGLFEAFEKAFKANAYKDEEEAIAIAVSRHEELLEVSPEESSE